MFKQIAQAIIVLFFVLCATACEQGIGDSGAADATPQPADANLAAQQQWEIWRGFYPALDQYQAENSITGDLKHWIIERSWTPSGGDPRRNRFFFPYTRARMPGGKTVKVLVKYQDGQDSFYNPPFLGGETQHLQLLQEFTNLWYKGWDFKFHPAGEISDAEADLIVVLGLPSDGTSYFDGEKTINLVYETIVIHESLHWLWFWHHYCGNPWDDQSQCTEHAPDEGLCIMERENGLGHVERFTLDIPPLTTEDMTRIEALSTELLSHYPGHNAKASAQHHEEVGCSTTKEVVNHHIENSLSLLPADSFQ